MNKFLDDVVMFYFSDFQLCHNIDICLFSADSVLLFISQAMPRKFQFDPRGLIGKLLKYLTTEIIKHICNVDDDHLEEVFHELQKASLLNDIVVRDEIMIKYLV